MISKFARTSSPRRARRSTRHLLAPLSSALALVALLAVAPSCSDDTPEKKRSSSSSSKKGKSSGSARGDSSEVAESARKLMRTAKKRKLGSYDKKSYRNAAKSMSQAKRLEEDGETAKANAKYAFAIKQLKKGMKTRAQVRSALKAAKELQVSFDELLTKADEAGTSENAPDVYKDAVKLYDESVAGLKKRSLRDVSAAKRSLEQALALLEEAQEIGAQNQVYRKQAEQAKVSAIQMKDRALAKGADTKSLQFWTQGDGQLSSGDLLLATGQFSQAIQTFDGAKQNFIRAIEDVDQAAELTGVLQNAEKSRAEYQKQQLELEKERFKRQEELERMKLAERAKLVKNMRGGGPGGPGGNLSFELKAKLPAGFDPENYRQDIDEEDEALLQEHYKKLSEAMTYDPETGAVALNYRRGPDLRKDLYLDRGIRATVDRLRAKKFLAFRNVFLENDSRDLTDPNAVDDIQMASQYSFECNTQGYFFLPVPFIWTTKVQYALQILTMDGNGSFSVLMMLDPKKSDGYITDFIHIGLMQNGNQSWVGRMPGEFNRSANEWFEKKREIWMINEFRMPNPDKDPAPPFKSGQLSVTYDALEEPTTNKVALKRFDKGYVGFRWHRTKCEVRKLVVTGIIDKQKAVEILRKKLKIKKKKKKKLSKKKTEKTRVASGKSPDTEQDEGSGEKREVGKKGDFDF